MPNTSILGSFSDVSGSSLMFRNKLINGNFDIWQRGTSVTGVANAELVADRWPSARVGSTINVSRQDFTLGQTDVPNEPTYFHRSVVTSVAGASNRANLYQQIEGVRTFAGQTVTLSFWAKADASKNIAVEFVQFFGSTGSAAVLGIGVTTFALTTSWKKFTATVNIPSISGKTLGSDGVNTLDILFWFDAGSSFNSRTNSLGQQSGTFDIAQVQLESGSVATAFENRPLGIELNLCYRYFWRLNTEVDFQGLLSGIFTAATLAEIVVRFPVEMRRAPNLEILNLRLTNGSAGSNVTAIDTVLAGKGSALFRLTCGSLAVATQPCSVIGQQTTRGYFQANAEF